MINVDNFYDMDGKKMSKVPAYRERRIMSYRKWDFGVIKVRDTHLICNDKLR